MNYISANDEKFLNLTDADAVQAAVNLAKETKICKVLIPRINKRKIVLNGFLTRQ